MIKHFVAGAAGIALFLASAAPVLATTTINNSAVVVNDVTTEANTGWNTINSLFDGFFNNNITTGPAVAKSEVKNDVNKNTVGTCLCESDLTINNEAVVANTVGTAANTGNNKINSGDPIDPLSINTIMSGAAGSQSTVSNTVNTNMVAF